MKKLIILAMFALPLLGEARVRTSNPVVEKVRTVYENVCSSCSKGMARVAQVLPATSQSLVRVGILASEVRGSSSLMRTASEALPTLAVKAPRDTRVVLGALNSYLKEGWTGSAAKNIRAFVAGIATYGSLEGAARALGLSAKEIREGCRG